jgi:hypothetical protein
VEYGSYRVVIDESETSRHGLHSVHVSRADEVGFYELRDRVTGHCHSVHATELAAIAVAEAIIGDRRPENAWWLMLVGIDGDGESRLVCEGEELLRLQVA